SSVTGVQTCALPISHGVRTADPVDRFLPGHGRDVPQPGSSRTGNAAISVGAANDSGGLSRPAAIDRGPGYRPNEMYRVRTMCDGVSGKADQGGRGKKP